MLALAEAIQAFGHGFARTRSQTYPVAFAPLGPLWAIQDDPPRPDSRKAELLADDRDPDEVVDLAQAKLPDAWLCVIHTGPERRRDLEAGYKRRGYRLVANEPFFVRDLHRPILGEAGPVRIARPASEAEWEAIRQGSRRRHEQVAREGDGDLRMYVAWDDGNAVGWVTSVQAQGGLRWAANLYVLETHRRQGIGAALMNAMLRDDASYGYRANVLLASLTGAKLYPTLGYEQIGLLQLFRPPKGSL